MTSCSVSTDYVEYLTHDLVKYHFLAEGGLPSGERLDCAPCYKKSRFRYTTWYKST